MEREIKIQDEIKRTIEQIIEKRYRFGGEMDITRIERDYPVDSGKADLVIFRAGEIPFLIIETKRKGPRTGELFNPLSRSGVGQVLCYAYEFKQRHGRVVPFVSFASPEKIAIFRVPENVEDYIDKEAYKRRKYEEVIPSHQYRRLITERLKIFERLYPTEEFWCSLLERLAQELVGKKIEKVEITDALIGVCRDFVEKVSDLIKPLVFRELSGKGAFRIMVEREGIELKQENLEQVASNLSRMMAYVLLNKIIFYKIIAGAFSLSRFYLPSSLTPARVREELQKYWREAIRATGDFEPIFSTGIYDQIPIPEDPSFVDLINEFVITIEPVDWAELGEKLGYMYEKLIPAEERHQLGQFYTPPWVCELITRWCIRSPNDVVLDPGCGSGGFLLKAYEVLREKKGASSVYGMVSREIHEQILNQLYAFDINHFPVHLTSMALAMRNVRTPSAKINVIPADFFSLRPGQTMLSYYSIETEKAGEVKRTFVIPLVDAVIGNPPYTRWTEIPEETKELIRNSLSNLIKRYRLTPQISRGKEPGIYTYWIMHATQFLKEGGRLGMIISNTWLQTDYGIGFGDFLLDNFRIRAIIDFTAKLFADALITTCILLAEKESDENKRLQNEVLFLHVPGKVESLDVRELLKVVETDESEKYLIKRVKQMELPRDRKWLDFFLGTIDISNHPLVTKLGEIFEPSYGNTLYLFLASTGKIRGVRNQGSSEFHYLSPSKLKEWNLEKWAYSNANGSIIYPAITSARRVVNFTFTKKDWEQTLKDDERCYMLICHIPREKLPKELEDYIKWGETECRAKAKERQIGGRGRLASETEAAKVRAKEKERFYGWYDLGGVIPVRIFAIYEGWYRTRFVFCEFPVALYQGLIALIPKENINEIQAKALLAFLNSSFAQAYIETNGRKSPGGVIGLEVSVAREMPILDVRKLSQEQLNLLAQLFEELEREARRIGGASTKEQIEKLKPKIYEIDRAIAKILGLKEEGVRALEAQVDVLVERRVGGRK